MATKTEKLFSVVGIAAGNGVYKVRFANDINRVKALTRAGFTDIRLASLETAMTKRDCVLAIQSMEDFQDALSQQLFADFLAEPEVVEKAPKKERAKKIKEAVAEVVAVAEAEVAAEEAATVTEEVTAEADPVEEVTAEADPVEEVTAEADVVEVAVEVAPKRSKGGRSKKKEARELVA